MAYFPPYLDAEGLHAPTYADRLDALLAGYREIFGSDVPLTPETPDYQLLSLLARALDDQTALMQQDVSAFDPDVATGQLLSRLVRLNGVNRESGETDEALRLRRSRAVGQAANGTLDALAARLWALPGMKTVRLVENDTDENLPDGQPPHTLQLLFSGAAEAATAEALYRYKPTGVPTWGVLTHTFTDEHGLTHTVHLSQAADLYALVTITLTPLDGYVADTMVPKMKAAVVDAINRLEVGQSLVVSTLYGVLYALCPDRPVFQLKSIRAGTSSSDMTDGILTIPARKRLRVIAGNITVTTV